MSEVLANIVGMLLMGTCYYGVGKGIGRVSNNKKFERDYYHGSKVKVILPEHIKSEGQEIDKELIEEKELSEEIMIFVERLLSNFEEKDLVNFYNRINEVNVSLGINNFMDLYNYFYARGEYVPSDNKIAIFRKKNKYTIFHELFHMASSKYNEKTDVCGFSYLDNRNQFGDGLNEGFTDHLVLRYFGDLFDADISYEYEEMVASKLEEIIGKELMESAYLNANLSAVIIELQKYSERKDILKFIKKLDILEKYAGTKNMAMINRDILEHLMFDVSDFLIRCYANKLKKVHKVATEDVVTDVFMYAKDLVDYHGDVVSCMCYEDVLNILEDIWQSDGLNKGIIILNESKDINIR